MVITSGPRVETTNFSYLSVQNTKLGVFYYVGKGDCPYQGCGYFPEGKREGSVYLLFLNFFGLFFKLV